VTVLIRNITAIIWELGSEKLIDDLAFQGRNGPGRALIPNGLWRAAVADLEGGRAGSGPPLGDGPAPSRYFR